jgi:hypothetical protein
MPKRRTDDVVHAVMTDHGIPKRIPDAEPLALKREAREADTTYRGQVVLLYPPSLPDNVETELYLLQRQRTVQARLVEIGPAPQRLRKPVQRLVQAAHPWAPRFRDRAIRPAQLRPGRSCTKA